MVILALCSNLRPSNPASDAAVGSLIQGIASVKLYASALAVLWGSVDLMTCQEF